MVTIVSTVPHKSVVKETFCHHCGATLEYVPNDIKTRRDRDYAGGTDIIRYIQCPNCGGNTGVK